MMRWSLRLPWKQGARPSIPKTFILARRFLANSRFAIPFSKGSVDWLVTCFRSCTIRDERSRFQFFSL